MSNVDTRTVENCKVSITVSQRSMTTWAVVTTQMVKHVAANCENMCDLRASVRVQVSATVRISV